MNDEIPLEVGALTEWDPLKEVIVGGFEAQFPVLSERVMFVVEASYPQAEIDDFKSLSGLNIESDDPERFERAKQEVMDLKTVFESLGVVVHLPRMVELGHLRFEQPEFVERHPQQLPVDRLEVRARAQRIAQLLRRGAQPLVRQGRHRRGVRGAVGHRLPQAGELRDLD